MQFADGWVQSGTVGGHMDKDPHGSCVNSRSIDETSQLSN